MICTLSSGEKVKLSDEDVKAAKVMVNKLLDNIRTVSAVNNRPAFYITALIVMESMSGDLLSTIEPKKLKTIVEILKEERSS